MNGFMLKMCANDRSHSSTQSAIESCLEISYFVSNSEKPDQPRYYDAQVIDIQRKLHDIRGCGCIFLVQYEHDKTQVTIEPVLIHIPSIALAVAK
ncbi:Chromo domain-like protein [Artemisia annua]|uniref:Chromo domain-like protein n=1 Tax=Artemisia annua TaxID=35608 RepID=A0A2U1M7T0_ARTAN|nr:Chromo domain-like protein [Artemisia annua]